MKTYALALVLVAGCVDSDPQVDLRNGGISVTVDDLSYPPAGPASDVMFELSTFDPTHQDANPSCIRVRPSSTITANGAAGTLTDAGSSDDNGAADTKECFGPSFEITLDPRPPTLDVVIADGTGQIALALALDSDQRYTVITSCTAASCM